jgi:hypothetical protein
MNPSTIGECVTALQSCRQWLDDNRKRLHAANCTYHRPDARCSCGLHRLLGELCAVTNDLSLIRDELKGA